MPKRSQDRWLENKNRTVGRNVRWEKALPGHFIKLLCTNTLQVIVVTEFIRYCHM